MAGLEAVQRGGPGPRRTLRGEHVDPATVTVHRRSDELPVDLAHRRSGPLPVVVPDAQDLAAGHGDQEGVSVHDGEAARAAQLPGHLVQTGGGRDGCSGAGRGPAGGGTGGDAGGEWSHQGGGGQGGDRRAGSPARGRGQVHRAHPSKRDAVAAMVAAPLPCGAPVHTNTGRRPSP